MTPSMKKKMAKERIGPDQVRVEESPKVSANLLIARGHSPPGSSVFCL